MSKLPSMAELENAKKGAYPPDVIVKVFQDYDRTGAAIIGKVCIDIIRKADLSRGDLSKIKEACIHATEFHEKRAGFWRPGERREARQWKSVWMYLETRV